MTDDPAQSELDAYRACMAEALGDLGGFTLGWGYGHDGVMLFIEHDNFELLSSAELPDSDKEILDAYLRATELIHPDWDGVYSEQVDMSSLDLVRMNRQRFVWWIP